MSGADIAGLVLRRGRPDDWPALAGITNAARAADGVMEVRTAESLAADYLAADPAPDIVIGELDGAPVGYAIASMVERDGVLCGEFRGSVHPAHRRRGIGTALLRASLDAVRARLHADTRPIPRELRAGAMDTERGDQALFAAEGFVPIRFGYEMRRSLAAALPVWPMPAGLELRPLVERDYRAVWEANEEAFLDHWGHRRATEQDFHEMCYGPDVTPGLWCVAWDGDEVAGVVMNAIYRQENAALGVERGWLDRVSVRRRWRGRGLAKALCADALRVLRDEGMAEAWLGVDGSNPTGAVQLYERLGFGVAHGWKVYGRPVDAPAPVGWRNAGDRATMGA